MIIHIADEALAAVRTGIVDAVDADVNHDRAGLQPITCADCITSDLR
jgi:hypothetical protein